MAAALGIGLVLVPSVAHLVAPGLPAPDPLAGQSQTEQASTAANPHGPFGPSTDSCASCHSSHTAEEPVLLTFPNSEASQNQVCTRCHGPGGGALEVSTHANADFSEATQSPFYQLCTDCHDAHSTPNSVAGDGINDHLIRTSIDSLPVVLDAMSGENSYDDGFDDGQHDSICVVCHTTTSHNSVTSEELRGQGHHPVGSDCLACHPHGSDRSARSGFMPADGDCLTCHDATVPLAPATDVTPTSAESPTPSLRATATLEPTGTPTAISIPPSTGTPKEQLAGTPTPTATPPPATGDARYLGEDEDLAVLGEAEGDGAGYALASGDIDGDGRGDLIIGARRADDDENADAGKTYVIFGGVDLTTEIDLSTSRAGLVVVGPAAGSQTGYAVAAADLNADGHDDLIVGAPGCRWCGNQENGTYVIYGRDELPQVIDLGAGSADVTISAPPGDRSGSALGTGDLNGDGRSDLVIGAPSADNSGARDAGAAYVVFGGDNLASLIELGASAEFTLLGDAPYDHSGSAVTVGDLNDDGVDDLVVGAPAADPSGLEGAGEIYVFHGGPDLPATPVLGMSSADVTVTGPAASARMGHTLAAGDVNGDGRDDLMIGAPGSDAPGGAEAGAVHVLYGGGLPGRIDLSASAPDVVVMGDGELDQAGSAIAVGDANGDGIGDLIVGAPGAGPAAGPAAGETYLLWGRRGLPSVVDLRSTSADLTVVGEGTGDGSGSALVVRDVDSVGAADLIIGAPGAAPGGRLEAGAVYALFGGQDVRPTSTPTSTPTPTPTPVPSSTPTATASPTAVPAPRATSTPAAAPTVTSTPPATAKPWVAPTMTPVPPPP